MQQKSKNLIVRLSAILGSGIALCALSAGTMLAQAPGGPPPPGSGAGGFQMPPEMAAKIEAYKKWGMEHKNLNQLSSTIGLIETMNGQPDTKLDKKQSAKLLSIINEWKGKSTLTESQAKTLQDQMTGLLNDKQKKQMASPEMRRAGMMRGMGLAGGGGMMGGPGGPMGKTGSGAGKMAPGGPMGEPGVKMTSGGPNGVPYGKMPPPGRGGDMPKGGPGGPMGGPGAMGGFQLPDPPKGGYNPLNPDTLPFEIIRPMAKKGLADFTATLQKQAK